MAWRRIWVISLPPAASVPSSISAACRCRPACWISSPTTTRAGACNWPAANYELCFTAPASEAFAIELAMAQLGVSASVIGHVTAEPGLRCLTPDGNMLALEQTGYRHFEAHVH